VRPAEIRVRQVNHFEGETMKRSTALAVGTALAAAVLSAGRAGAALTMTLSEPGFSVVNVPYTAGSSTISYSAAYGDYTTDIVAGFSNSGTPGSIGQLQLESLDVKDTTGAATGLTITFSDNGFTFPGAVGSLLLVQSALGGTLTNSAAGNSVTFQTTATPGAGAAAVTPLQTYTSPGSPLAPLPFDMPTTSATFVQSGSYTLGEVLTFSLSGAGSAANLSGSSTVTAAVPEPASLAAASLAGIALLGRRSRKR
jgi:hypothetical protein